MRRRALVLAAALGMTGVGGVAWAGWVTEVTAGPFTVHARRLPTMDAPAVRPGVVPRISWTPVGLARGYVVVRHVGQRSAVACEVPATAAPRCADVGLPPGLSVSYTVAATYRSWTGPESDASETVTLPGLLPGRPDDDETAPRGVVTPSPSAIVTPSASPTPSTVLQSPRTADAVPDSAEPSAAES